MRHKLKTSPVPARTLAMFLVFGSSACAPLVRPAPFPGAQGKVTDATLLGPFDGQIVDASTGEPIVDATIVAVWTYAHGDGLIGPYGSEVREIKTDEAGRYRIPPSSQDRPGATARLVSFQLIVYKRGYVGYRSNVLFDGSPRSDFTTRHNRIQMTKWRDADSHAQHLLFLGAPRSIQKLNLWEQDLANRDLLRQQIRGEEELRSFAQLEQEEISPAKPLEAKADMLLDASNLLTSTEIVGRTNYTGTFTVGEPTDLQRTSFYHGVHFQAVDQDPTWDVMLRVWKQPPGGLEPVIETIEENFPDVEKTDEVTAETWIKTFEGVYAVAFIEREQNVGIILTCGTNQCADVETAIMLAKLISRQLDRLQSVKASPNKFSAQKPETDRLDTPLPSSDAEKNPTP